MKKLMKPIVTLLLVFSLVACSQTATPTGSTSEKEKEKSEETSSELTLDQVYEKSLKASEELKSFSVNMDLNQTISAAQQEAMEIQSSITMDIVMEPMTFYQKMNMSMDSENMTTEAYFSKDGMFINDPTTNTWMKFPTEMSDQLLQLSNQQTNPAEELKKLQEFVKDFSFEQDDKNYILTLNASGEKLDEFIKETALEGMPAELTADPTIFESMKINGAKMVYHIDKETFFPVKTDVFMDMEISAEGETVHMIQDMKGSYSKFNENNSLTVPQEILDTAQEMEL